jgi:hypothetical protein
VLVKPEKKLGLGSITLRYGFGKLGDAGIKKQCDAIGLEEHPSKMSGSSLVPVVKYVPCDDVIGHGCSLGLRRRVRANARVGQGDDSQDVFERSRIEQIVRLHKETAEFTYHPAVHFTDLLHCRIGYFSARILHISRYSCRLCSNRRWCTSAVMLGDSHS